MTKTASSYSFYVPQAKLAAFREDNKPETCPLLTLPADKFSPVVDHDHRTGRIRGVISLEVNALIGKIENFYRTRCANNSKGLPTLLRAIATYLEAEQGPYHPVGLKQITRRFTRLPKPEQLEALNAMGVSVEQITSCRSALKRAGLYRKLLVEGRKDPLQC
jgi:hypothetical protein